MLKQNLAVRIDRATVSDYFLWLDTLCYEAAPMVQQDAFSEEKLRLIAPPELADQELRLQVIPYSWNDLQRRRKLQIQYQANSGWIHDPFAYVLGAIILTANALIMTSDGKIVFHHKKGAAAPGKIHTFGGYVTTEDKTIGDTIIRELSEPDELGLDATRITVQKYFGTPEGMPSGLWNHGTAAVYGLTQVTYSAAELQDRFAEISHAETSAAGLMVISPEQLRGLEEKMHPQTHAVLSTMEEILHG